MWRMAHLGMPHFAEGGGGRRCSPGVADQKCHLGGRDRFSGNDQVAFIFAVLRIKDNDEFTIF